MSNGKQLLEQYYQHEFSVQSIEQIVSGQKTVRFNAEKTKQLPFIIELGREITGGEPPAPIPRSLDVITIHSQYITFDGGCPVGMYGNASCFSNGAWNLSVHMHNSGAIGFNGALVLALRVDGAIFVFPVHGSMGGILGGSRDFDINTSSPQPNIALAEAMRRANGYQTTWRAAAQVSVPSITDLIQDITAGAAFIALL
jgi:hypothetical protein